MAVAATVGTKRAAAAAPPRRVRRFLSVAPLHLSVTRFLSRSLSVRLADGGIKTRRTRRVTRPDTTCGVYPWHGLGLGRDTAYRACDALTNVHGGHYTRDEDNNGRHGKRAVPPPPCPADACHFPKRLRAPTVSAAVAPAKVAARRRRS